MHPSDDDVRPRRAVGALLDAEAVVHATGRMIEFECHKLERPCLTNPSIKYTLIVLIWLISVRAARVPKDHWTGRSWCCRA